MNLGKLLYSPYLKKKVTNNSVYLKGLFWGLDEENKHKEPSLAHSELYRAKPTEKTRYFQELVK